MQNVENVTATFLDNGTGMFRLENSGERGRERDGAVETECLKSIMAQWKFYSRSNEVRKMGSSKGSLERQGFLVIIWSHWRKPRILHIGLRFHQKDTSPNRNIAQVFFFIYCPLVPVLLYLTLLWYRTSLLQGFTFTFIQMDGPKNALMTSTFRRTKRFFGLLCAVYCLRSIWYSSYTETLCSRILSIILKVKFQQKIKINQFFKGSLDRVLAS